MKSLKEQKGITLVALVITIIVLLILAGIALSLVMGDDGILGRASGAAKAQREAEAKEKTIMELVNLEAEYYELKYSATAADNAKVVGYDDAVDAALKNLGKKNIGGNSNSVIKDVTVTSNGTNPATITVDNGTEIVTFNITHSANNQTFVFAEQTRTKKTS